MPQLRVLKKPESVRHHANDRRWSAVDEEPPADDVWIIPIPRRPQARGDHDDWRRPRSVVYGLKAAATDRHFSQEIESCCGNVRAHDAIGRVLIVGDCDGRTHVRGNPDEAFLRRPQRVELGVGQATRRPALRVAGPDRQDALRRAGGQSPQTDGVDDREEGRIHADAESERQHGDSSKTRRASELPAGMTDVSRHVLQPDERPCVTVQVLGECDAPHRPPRGEARFVRRHPATAVFILEQRKMRRQLARQLAFGVAMRK